MKKLAFIAMFVNIGFAATINLASGVPNSSSVLKDEMKIYKIHGDAGKKVAILMDQLQDDADLYVKIGATPTRNSYDCRSIETQTRVETCNLDIIQADDVYIGVFGYRATDYRVKATLSNASQSIVLSSGVAESGSVEQDIMNYYKISATNGERVDGVIDHLNADADIYIKAGSKPTKSSFDCKSTQGGTTADSCGITLSQDQDVYIGVFGYRATTYQVKATKSNGVADTISLTSGVAESGSVTQGETKFYKISAHNGDKVVSLLDHLNADADIYVKVGSKPTANLFDCKSTHGGKSADSCDVTLTQDADVYIGVYGYRATSYQVKATKSADNGDNSLTSNVAKAGSVTQDSMKYYKIPALFADRVVVTLTQLTADADIYVKVGSKPTTSLFDCKSTNGGTSNEVCNVTLLDDTDVYVGVYGFRSADYSVKAKIERDVAPANPTVLEDAEDGTLNPNWRTVRGDKPPFICTSNGKTMMANHANGQGDALYRYELTVNNTTQKVLSIDIGGGSTCRIGNRSKGYMPHYAVGVYVETKLGTRYMEWNSWDTHQGYDPRKVTVAGGNTFLYYPSPVEMVRGWYAPITTWTHFEVNLDTELKRLEPNNRIYKIVEFYATGGFLDNITLSSAN